MGTQAHKGAPVEELLERIQPGFSADVLAEAIERVVDRQHRTVGTAALTAEQQEFWDRHSGVPRDPELASRALAAATAAGAIHEATSLTGAQVAERLGVDPSTVRHYAGSRRLYSYKSRGRLLYPAWQFGNAGTVPHLATVLAALPDDAHPQTIQGFFTTPQPDLRLSGAPCTPAEWLSSGGDPEKVAGLAASVGRL